MDASKSQIHLKKNLAPINQSMFICKSNGKLKDYYRIGRILGTGKYRKSLDTYHSPLLYRYHSQKKIRYLITY